MLVGLDMNGKEFLGKRHVPPLHEHDLSEIGTSTLNPQSVNRTFDLKCQIPKQCTLQPRTPGPKLSNTESDGLAQWFLQGI